MTISEADFEQLSQLLDGELDTQSQQRLEQRIAREADLADTWARLQAINAELQGAYGDSATAAGGVPTAVRALLRDQKTPERGSSVVPLFAPRRQLWPTALAASLVVAVAVAVFQAQDGGSPRDSITTLAAVLEARASGDDWQVLEDGREVRAVLTFPARGDRWCREFLLRETGSESPLRGVACRRGDDWATEVLAQGGGPDSADVYRPAGAADSSAVEVFIREHAADIPLDGVREADLIQRNWR